MTTEITTEGKALYVVSLEVFGPKDTEPLYVPRFPTLQVECRMCRGTGHRDSDRGQYSVYYNCPDCGGDGGELPQHMENWSMTIEAEVGQRGRGWNPSEDLEAWLEIPEDVHFFPGIGETLPGCIIQLPEAQQVLSVRIHHVGGDIYAIAHTEPGYGKTKKEALISAIYEATK